MNEPIPRTRTRAVTSDTENLISLKEAAAMLDVKSATLRRWLNEGVDLPYYRIGQRVLKFKRSDVRTFINQSLEVH